ncbi:glycosyltransferase family 4 protein [Quadrisphaera sp. DSM 44207]|uniref:glycosyltransferase family 4 protein n=1 Tax=Quadrisphaera sp. DSM 44207 TaxID=1881057 RepID=UPI0015A1B3F3|nr:glycosyltransferase family 4 protein [Quadrisphaera sp. DSM 44207]
MADELQPHGGAERSQVDVAEGLARRGHAIDLVHRGDGPFRRRYERFATSITRVGAVQGDGSRRTDAQLLAAAVRCAPTAGRVDCVYVNSARVTFFGALLAAPRRRALVCHLRLPQPPARSVKNRLGMAAVTRFVAVSEHTRDVHVADGVDPGVVDVVHNGIDTATFRPAEPAERAAARAALGLSASAFAVLYAGRLDPAKGPDVLLRAWRDGHGMPPERTLLVAGAPREHGGEQADAYVRSLRELASGTDVRWLGRRDDLAPLLAAADAVAVPSVFEEPFGRVVVEGMSSGLPVVASATGGIPEILSGFPDLLVPPGDPRALAGALARTASWRGTDPELGRRLRRHVQASFSLAATVAGVERALVRAVGARRGA